jgi:putative ABC transport system ATP-binding protein
MSEPMNSKVILEAQGIVKVLGTPPNEVEVLKGIDLELHTGELTLLMGPSGSGKTTLLSILGCILTLTAGTLSLVGPPTQDLNTEVLASVRGNHVGFVFQSYNLVPTLTATENVVLALDLKERRGPDAYADAAEALRAVGLGHRLNAMPSKLSGGEKLSASIARALAGSPSLLLAAEPPAALDGNTGMAVMELLANVAHDTRRAVLAVTHDHRTLQFADRILTIDDGRIAGSERPKRYSDNVEVAAHA